MFGKKVLAMVLFITLLASFLGGCADTGSSGTTQTTAATLAAQTTTAPATKAATSAATTAAAATAAEKSTAPVKEDPVLVYFVDYPRTDASDDQSVLDFINEKFNVDFHFVQPARDTFNEKFSTMLAAQSDIDFFIGWYADRTNVRSIDVLRENDMIVPLDDLLAKYGPNLLANVEAAHWELAKTDGQIWFIPNVQFASKTVLWYRQDWLDAIGYTTPPKTIDDFEVMLRKLKEENPGRADNFYPLVAEHPYYLNWGFMNSFTGTCPTYLETDGTIKPSYLHTNYKLYLETMARWVKDGLLNPDQPTMNNNTMTDLLTREQSGVWSGWFTNSKQDLLQTANPASVVNYMEYPVGPSGTSGAMAVNIFSGGGPVIMKHTSDAAKQKIIEMLDWFNTEEGQLFNWYGIEGKHWVMEGDKVAPAPGVDASKPPYNQKYLVAGGNMYKFFKESTLTVPQITGDIRQAAITGAYPCIYAPDYMFPYNWIGTKSVDYLTDLTTTMVDQLVADVITGEKPVSYYDEWVEQWMAAGGEQYLKELNDQYQALK